jgi:hypothetical protein
MGTLRVSAVTLLSTFTRIVAADNTRPAADTRKHGPPSQDLTGRESGCSQPAKNSKVRSQRRAQGRRQGPGLRGMDCGAARLLPCWRGSGLASTPVASIWVRNAHGNSVVFPIGRALPTGACFRLGAVNTSKAFVGEEESAADRRDLRRTLAKVCVTLRACLRAKCRPSMRTVSAPLPPSPRLRRAPAPGGLGHWGIHPAILPAAAEPPVRITDGATFRR